MSPIFYRLMEHMAYTNTQDANESPHNPNEGGAENLLLGTVEELQSVNPPRGVTFGDADISSCFNQYGEATYHPWFANNEGGRTFLVAWVIDPSHDEASKINVYGIYKIKGMHDILTNYNKKIQWKTIVISKDFYQELTEKISYKKGIRLLPTPNYHRISDEEKTVKKYTGVRIQKVPVPSKLRCVVS